jgi:hypothetical protein
MSTSYSISESASLALTSDLSAAAYVSSVNLLVAQSRESAERAADLDISAAGFKQSAFHSYNIYAQRDKDTVIGFELSAAMVDLSAQYFSIAAFNADVSAIAFNALVLNKVGITVEDVSNARYFSLQASESATFAQNAANSSAAFTYYEDASGAYQHAYDYFIDASNAYSLAYSYLLDTSNSATTARIAYDNANAKYLDTTTAYNNARIVYDNDYETDISSVLYSYLSDISGHTISAQNHSSNAWNYYVDASSTQLRVANTTYKDGSMNVHTAELYAQDASGSKTRAYNAYTSKLATETAAAAAAATTEDYFVPKPFSEILDQTYTMPASPIAVTALGNRTRYIFKHEVNGETSYLSMNNDNYKLTRNTQTTTTYKDILSRVFEVVKNPDNTFRMDSDLNCLYSLDQQPTANSNYSPTNPFLFSNNWGQYANTSSGYVQMKLYQSNKLQTNGASRQVISDASTFEHIVDNRYSYTGYLRNGKDGGSILYGLDGMASNGVTFTIYKSPINTDMPSDFNPFQIAYQPNSRVSIAGYVGTNAKNTISIMDERVKRTGGKSLMSKYRGQVDVSGRNVNTDASANAMLDTIFATVPNLRYSKAVYKAFREGALNTTLACESIADGTLGQNTTPYVYYTIEQTPNGDYHPFMVIASYSISDKPNRLLDVCRPPANGDDYETNDVTRDATLQNYLTKIPMVNYGEVTNLTDNTMSATLLSAANAIDKAGITTQTPYNYASISAIGIAIDGVVIYPMSNNTLHPAQAQAEITNTGIHIGRGMGLHYHADGHSATSNNLNLYNSNDYVGRRHPPLIGFGFDGIALYGKYDINHTGMHGYSNQLDQFGGHSHGNYGYHYHAHTVPSNELTGLTASTSGVIPEVARSDPYTLHILMKGAWAGRINSIPEFWANDKGPNYTIGTNSSKFVGLSV